MKAHDEVTKTVEMECVSSRERHISFIRLAIFAILRTLEVELEQVVGVQASEIGSLELERNVSRIILNFNGLAEFGGSYGGVFLLCIIHSQSQ